MHKFFFSLLLALMACSVAAQTINIKKGDEAHVPGHAWVTVMNPKPVQSVNRSLPYGDTCSVHRGGKVTVVALTNQGEKQVLVHYTAQDVAGGAMCPTGTLFFMTQQGFSTITAEYNRSMTNERHDRERIQRILDEQK